MLACMELLSMERVRRRPLVFVCGLPWWFFPAREPVCFARRHLRWLDPGRLRALRLMVGWLNLLHSAKMLAFLGRR